ncbi:MAG: PLP-dependent aminotransferase family protein [Clostridia bacterium]|nr:PLP-dependent aminotransferase family protein [Clostridia bacterium]
MEYRFSDKLAALKPSAIREIFKSLTDPSIIAFAAGNPAAETFPIDEMAEISREIYADMAVTALQYGTTEGYMPLRRAIADRQRARFGIGKTAEDGLGFADTTVIVSGGNQGIELACKAFCNEGDAVVCEDPSFIGALNSFRSNGAVTLGVPLREDGIDTAALEELLKREKRAKLLYLIPTFQNPSGITSTLENRKKVYEIALRHGVMIIEDNPYGELRFAGTDVPTYKSFDTEGIVIYCSSFSKILSSGMRVGYLTAPEEVIQKIVVAKQVEDVHTNMFFQILCHRYMTERDFEGHIADVRAVYRRKCGLMLDCLDRSMPAGVSFTRPEGGLFIWCTLPAGVDINAYVKRCLERKVALVPGSAFTPVIGAPCNSVRMSYSTATDAQIAEGCRVIGEVAREMIGD